MMQVFEAGDRVQVDNTSLDCDMETGKVTEVEPLGPDMFLYKVKLDNGRTVKLDNPSVSQEL